MATQIPSADDVRKRLSELGRGQMQELSDLSGVPFTTLANIRNSKTDQGPTVGTLQKFWPHLLRLVRTKAGAESEQKAA